MRSPGNICAVHGCRSSKRRKENISFFNLPSDEDRLKKWAELIGRPDLAGPNTKRKSHFVCSLHFDSSSITYTPKLRADVLPSICLPSEDQMEDLDPGPPTSSRVPNTKEASTQTEYSNKGNVEAGTGIGESPDYDREDEFDIFCRSLAYQLKRMPRDRALICQGELQAVMTAERLSQYDTSI